MERTSMQSAPIVIYSDNATKKAWAAVNSEDFMRRIQSIWHKVTLLEKLGVIQDEEARFNYAYRFAEIELQKVFIENLSLRDQLNGS